MKTLIVGIGALGGVIAARLRATDSPVWMATRDAESADRLKASGLRVTGVGSALSIDVGEVAPVEMYGAGQAFDLIVLATKAHDAIDAAPRLARLLGPGGAMLPI
jgi:2-dehydropantoate 2-reductase